MKKIISIILATWAYCSVVAQAPDYNHLSLQPNADFYTIRNATQHYYDSTGLDTVQGSGYKQFKRWESFWTTRVGDNSNAGSFQNTFESFAAFATNPNLCNGGTYNEQWQFIGHNTTETSNSGPNWGRGQGILIKVYVDMVHESQGIQFMQAVTLVAYGVQEMQKVQIQLGFALQIDDSLEWALMK